MRVLCIVGTQLRHLFVLGRIAKNFDVAGVVLMERSLVQPAKIDGRVFSDSDIEFERKHLESLTEQEHVHFYNEVNDFDIDSYPIKKVTNSKELNSHEVINWVMDIKPDVVLDYGSGILSDEFLDVLPEWRINLHGGLSPWYKGSATLLWPFYFQQPGLAGTTYHLLGKNIDGGDILQHSRPSIYADDTVTKIGCRAVVQAADDGVALLRMIQNGEEVQRYPQKGNGKLFLEKDYSPHHLRTVYQLIDEGMLANYLQNQSYYDAGYKFVDQLRYDDISLRQSA